MSLLRAPILKNSVSLLLQWDSNPRPLGSQTNTQPFIETLNYLAEIHFIFLKTSPRSKFKGFQYQIWTSVNRRGEIVIK